MTLNSFKRLKKVFILHQTKKVTTTVPQITSPIEKVILLNQISVSLRTTQTILFRIY